ncbi:MAG TPA: AGE family epimerase/isomerase [Steroidobacteraceae bacterium]|jgi:mannose-6-phosphate isomerase|nr:AGE family epimerase/isomerase [Steroidobacteraceae bacterium]
MDDNKARIAAHHDRLSSWLCDAAYPLWATRGVDAAGGFHERLAHNGEPLVEPRRSRVNPRQAYCFAVAPSLGWRGDTERLIDHALDYWIARYRRPDGLFRTLVNADGSPRDDRALLYDQAFGLLAFNVCAIGEARATRERQALELHGLVIRHMKRAGQPGFESGVPPSLPLLSNPHMHLFEAALAGCEVCSESSLWKTLADEIAALALDKFIDTSSGALREFFDADWKPAAGLEGRIVEPGHQFEWAWLLLRWGGASHARARAAALELIDIGESRGVKAGLAMNSLLDDWTPHDAGARLWPQTERLKAASIAARLTGEAKYFAMAASAADGLMRYLDTPLPGLWRDRIDADGRVVDEPAPASSFYHLVAAIGELSALARV